VRRSVPHHMACFRFALPSLFTLLTARQECQEATKTAKAECKEVEVENERGMKEEEKRQSADAS